MVPMFFQVSRIGLVVYCLDAGWCVVTVMFVIYVLSFWIDVLIVVV